MTRPLLTGLLLSLALAAPAAHAEAGQFRVKPLAPKAIQGLGAPASARFHARVEALSAYLAGLPALAGPPAPLCVELNREVWAYPLLPMGQALISYNYLVPLSRQTCASASVVNSNLVFALNHLSFIDKNNRVMEDAQGIVVQPEEYRELGPGLYKVGFRTRQYWVMTRGEPPLLAATMERVLSQRIAELEARRAAMQDLDERVRRPLEQELRDARAALERLTPAQRALPACVEALRGGLQLRTVPGPCQAGQAALLGLNPALAAAGPDPAALRVLVLEAMGIRHSTEAQAHYEHRQALVQGLDFAALQQAWQTVR